MKGIAARCNWKISNIGEINCISLDHRIVCYILESIIVEEEFAIVKSVAITSIRTGLEI